MAVWRAKISQNLTFELAVAKRHAPEMVLIDDAQLLSWPAAVRLDAVMTSSPSTNPLQLPATLPAKVCLPRDENEVKISCP